MPEGGVPAPPETCWLHPGVEVRESPIAGRGLFATEMILAGTVVARLGGRLVSGVELHELLASSPAYVDPITVLPDVHLVLPGRQPNGFGNHSCDPTRWHADAYTLTARSDIHDGDEVTVDYGTQTAEPDFTMDCQCGGALRRGTVTGADWQRPELQQRYGDHWVPALRPSHL